MGDKDIAVNAVRLADENNHYYGTERSEELGLAVRALADEVERLRNQAVGVKPLEWVWFDGTLDGVLKAQGYMAKTPVFYAVVFQEERPNPDKWSEWRWYATNTLNTPCASPEEGKQLAEQHWRAYIKQALVEVQP